METRRIGSPGSSCNLSISFTPQSKGKFAQTAAFFDDALNAAPASQSVVLSGDTPGSGLPHKGK